MTNNLEPKAEVIKKSSLDIPSDTLGYQLEAYSFEPKSKLVGLIVTAFGVPRGQDNDKSYVPDRFAPYIAETGFVTTAHSPEGLGKSGGDTTQLSLDGRASEVAAVAAAAHTQFPDLALAIYGSSMGSHLAIRAAKRLAKAGVQVDTLVLVSSAAYPDRSEPATFGDAFKQAITGAHELPKSAFSVFDDLLNFPGKVILTWVEHDSAEKGGPIYPQMIGWYNDTYHERQAAGGDDAGRSGHRHARRTLRGSGYRGRGRDA